uniref:Late embryogenesis abundant n=1 Tax=Cleistogenes songorica TaxID=121774 RepID=A0A2S1WLQ8_9POAL|nr:late embryogenesis abundant [Cleistogenes songorica]
MELVSLGNEPVNKGNQHKVIRAAREEADGEYDVLFLQIIPDVLEFKRMSQQQPRRPSDQQQAGGEQGAVRYGDVFPVSGGLADQPIAPQDAATMQSAESLVFGQTLKGGPAATMQSAATTNERMGVVGHDQATDATAMQGVTVSETRVPGGRMFTEFVAGQAVGQAVAQDVTKVTIGEALEATALAAGDVPVERSDAAAIQAAEARATGLHANIPGGLAEQAQSAAVANEMAAREEDKTTLGDVLTDATSKLVADKPVDSSDALRVAGAESRNKGDATARPGGVAASMAAAARLNRDEAAVEVSLWYPAVPNAGSHTDSALHRVTRADGQQQRNEKGRVGHPRDVTCNNGVIRPIEMADRRKQVIRPKCYACGSALCDSDLVGRSVTLDRWIKHGEINVDDIAVDDPRHLDLLPEHRSNRSAARLTLDRDLVKMSTPTLSMLDENVFHLGCEVKSTDETAWILTIDVSKKRLEDLASFPADRVRYLPCALSKNMSIAPYKVGGMSTCGYELTVVCMPSVHLVAKEKEEMILVHGLEPYITEDQLRNGIFSRFGDLGVLSMSVPANQRISQIWFISGEKAMQRLNGAKCGRLRFGLYWGHSELTGKEQRGRRQLPPAFWQST